MKFWTMKTGQRVIYTEPHREFIELGIIVKTKAYPGSSNNQILVRFDDGDVEAVNPSFLTLAKGPDDLYEGEDYEYSIED